MLYGETVTVLVAGTTQDADGNDIEDWTDPTETEVEGVGIEPRPVGEVFQNDRNAVVNGYTLYDDSNQLAAVTAQDRIRVRGKDWPVNGQPAEWRNPLTGWRPGTVVQVGGTDG